MKLLCQMLERMGLRGVKSYIQSGNVVFCSDRPAAELAGEIAEQVLQQFGFKPQLLLLNADAFREAVTNSPFELDKSQHFYFLLSPAKSPDLQRLQALASPTERLSLKHEVLYLYAHDGIGRSRLVSQIEKCLGVAVTARNGNTVGRLLTMVEEGREDIPPC